MTNVFKFITAITTIINSIAFPSFWDAFFVIAKELVPITFTTSFEILKELHIRKASAGIR